ncbi:hypothetical protein TraAM80_01454 [Trypanosoma rangeli]|uniref:Uncharacterized protein n=1 Tax=Trypanosoma rangeli TaxID=5698 RepID=A0A422NYV6_TRYRA|nr:uncharacterized protein TraAM80_01454 [Trypanosoma rangeli]RNF10638.1 hypothetical protein TraAM80_01454 [Trypanosoma rangeli]|eukprot:RNF10638.1 hypothetical protein TraAM80_01454 [Trypanosoma rangeli]
MQCDLFEEICKSSGDGDAEDDDGDLCVEEEMNTFLGELSEELQSPGTSHPKRQKRPASASPEPGAPASPVAEQSQGRENGSTQSPGPTGRSAPRAAHAAGKSARGADGSFRGPAWLRVSFLLPLAVLACVAVY